MLIKRDCHTGSKPAPVKHKPAANHPWRRKPKTGSGIALPYVCPDERTEQKAVFSWARLLEKQRPELKMLYHPPNGAHCSDVSRARLVLEGLRVGVPDIILPVARGRYFGLAVELKRKTGGVLRAEQALWLSEMRRYGWYAVVCRGADEAIRAIENYLDLGDFAACGASLDMPAPDIVDSFFNKKEGV